MATTTLSAEVKIAKTPNPPSFQTVGEERLHRKQRLASAFRLFAKFGFSEGVAGHITVRDPEFHDHFWVNPFGMHFAHIRVSDLILVNEKGSPPGNVVRATSTLSSGSILSNFSAAIVWIDTL